MIGSAGPISAEACVVFSAMPLPVHSNFPEDDG
jgi:hypothetical protein